MGCNLSLANEAHPVVARHPGTSFTVNHPQEAVPKSTNGRLSPSLPWSSLFWDPYKQGSSWWHYTFPCVPGLEFKSIQWCFTHFTYIILISSGLLRGSNRFILLLNIIIKVFGLFQFQIISNSKYFNWWFKLICFCDCDSVLDLKHFLSLINTDSYSL